VADPTYIKGLDALNAVLQQVPVKIERNVMRGALRAGMNQVKPVAQANIHSVSGELARGLKVGTRARGGAVTANLKATGPHRFIAHLLEFGVRAHAILAKGKGWLSFLGLFAKKVEHPGFAPKPFMRPALDTQARAAVVAAAEYTKTRLATKEGLDTSHIMIEGDE
jgi:HK97 gp10 family phage protein